MTPMTERFELRVDEELLEKLDSWRGTQADVPSRAEAMRRLVEIGLTRAGGDKVKLTDGDKLQIMMLRDIYKELKISKGEIDPDFVGETIWGGHTWALKWEMSGLYHGHEDEARDVDFVVEVLAMWDHVERGHEALSKKDQERIKTEGHPFNPRFRGFDGNNEAAPMGIARFFVEKMGRFERFKGRDFNAHMPTVAGYRRMLTAFEPMQQAVVGGELSASQIITLLGVQRHPG
jgi:uncharacterized protein YfbU (UPF0304 family)